MRRNLSRYIVLVIGLLLFVNCNGSTPTPPPELPTIRLGWTAWAGWYPLVVIKEENLDKKYGFQLELIYNQDISGDENDWEIGKVDAAFVDTGSVVVRNDKKPNSAKAILISDRSALTTIVAVPEIKTVADLKGKRVGTLVGSTYGELMIRRMLESNNVDPKEVELVNLDGSDVPKAMPDVIDAGTTWEPYLTEAKNKGFNEIYSSAADDKLPVSGVLLMRTQMINDRPKAVQGVVSAWFEAVKLWQADPKKYSAAVAKIVGGTAEDVAQSQANFISLEQNVAQFTEGGLAEEFKVATDFFITISLLNHPPDQILLLDGTFVKQAVAQ